jgi:hypothetical protein
MNPERNLQSIYCRSQLMILFLSVWRGFLNFLWKFNKYYWAALTNFMSISCMTPMANREIWQWQHHVTSKVLSLILGQNIILSFNILVLCTRANCKNGSCTICLNIAKGWFSMKLYCVSTLWYYDALCYWRLFVS